MTSKCNQEEAAEVDTIGEQQLKGVQSGMKWMQLGSSWVCYFKLAFLKATK